MAAQAESLCNAAADVLRRAKKGEGIRQIIYSMQLPASTMPQLQAIVHGVEKHESLILDVASKSGVMAQVPGSFLIPDNKLLLVLLYEALLGSRRVRGQAQIVEFIKTNKAKLQQCLAELRKSGKVETFREKIRLPRFVRVNTLKITQEDALAHFRARKWTVEEGSVESGAGDCSTLNPKKGTIVLDPLVPNLLVFPPATSLHGDSMVAAGSLILQDRSSCLSAQAMFPLPKGAVAADACAAPGNKTSHLASLIRLADQEAGLEDDGEPKGRILVHAFERDKNREKMLRRQMSKLCQEGVQVHGDDFKSCVQRTLKDREGPLMDVTHVLCDPSCSGSGLVAQYQPGGIKTGEEDTTSAEHDHGSASTDIPVLAAEQKAIVLAAMTLPRVEVVVYSTCSIHREENEDVVSAILDGCDGRFILANTLPNWPHRGLSQAGTHATSCVRATHEKDSTNGFFVARFERVRKKSKSEQSLPNSSGDKQTGKATNGSDVQASRKAGKKGAIKVGISKSEEHKAKMKGSSVTPASSSNKRKGEMTKETHSKKIKSRQESTPKESEQDLLKRAMTVD